ncbi:uncharacterized protein LOC143453166 isoform X2 [Clavelina lepadiformis]|uniref:uncharacterized protein LOC143453166 isoform X2 n=1 Tax=Clavelina lepadiformis TaxID=159417 RepID=UPI004042009A
MVLKFILFLLLLGLNLTVATNPPLVRNKRRPDLCQEGKSEIVVETNASQRRRCGYCNNIQFYNHENKTCDLLPQDGEMCSHKQTFSFWDACKKTKCITYGEPGKLGLCSIKYWDSTSAVTKAPTTPASHTSPKWPAPTLPTTEFRPNTPILETPTNPDTTKTKNVNAKYAECECHLGNWGYVIAFAAGFCLCLLIVQWKEVSQKRCSKIATIWRTSNNQQAQGTESEDNLLPS